MSMEKESRHSIAIRSIFGITMSSIPLELCDDTLIENLVSDIRVHDIKPAHKTTIPDTALCSTMELGKCGDVVYM